VQLIEYLRHNFSNVFANKFLLFEAKHFVQVGVAVDHDSQVTTDCVGCYYANVLTLAVVIFIFYSQGTGLILLNIGDPLFDFNTLADISSNIEKEVQVKSRCLKALRIQLCYFVVLLFYSRRITVIRGSHVPQLGD